MKMEIKSFEIIENHWFFDGVIEVHYYLRLTFTDNTNTFIKITDEKKDELVKTTNTEIIINKQQ